MDKFPCWIIQDGNTDGYGFPVLPVGKFGGPVGLKIALHQGASSAVDPDGDAVTYAYAWRRNDKPIANLILHRQRLQ